MDASVSVGLVVAALLLFMVWLARGGGGGEDGYLPDGAACSSSFDCASQTCCRDADGGGADGRATCRPPGECPDQGLGESCERPDGGGGSSSRGCQPGLECCTGPEDDDWFCRMPSACRGSNEGAACASARDCTPDVVCCASPDERDALKCRRPEACVRPESSPCTRDRECEGGLCCGGRCRSPETCEDASPKPAGEPCDSPRDCLSQVCCGDPSSVCRDSLDACADEGLLAVGEPCSTNASCQTRTCCSRHPDRLTCEHPDDCLRDPDVLCAEGADCRSGLCCQRADDPSARRRCQTSGGLCLREEGDDCSPSFPCETGLACCRSPDVPDGRTTCRPPDRCLLEEGGACEGPELCADPSFLCCEGREGDPTPRCRPQDACATVVCPVRFGSFRACDPTGDHDPCPTCHRLRACRTLGDGDSFAFVQGSEIGSPLLEGLPGSWCLPPPPEEGATCVPRGASIPAFFSEAERWGCYCLYPKLVSQSTLGGTCDVVLACRPHGSLVHRTTQELFDPRSSTWDPAEEGMCLCAPGYEYVETEDGEKQCVATAATARASARR